MSSVAMISLLPLKIIFPSTGFLKPINISISVDFPDPDSPAIPINSPCSICNDTLIPYYYLHNYMIFDLVQ